MNLLVTGGNGFIGSNFILYWKSKYPHDSIINVDKMTYASNPTFTEHLLKEDGYKLINSDICNYEQMNKLAGEVDIIVNFAAETHVDNSIRKSHSFVQSNIVGVHSLLEAARQNEIRFHQVSTDEVYGTLPAFSQDKFTVNSPYNPRNPYSATKASSDFLVKSYFNTYGLKATISNCGNNFGPMQHPEKLIPKTIISALKNIKIPVYGDGMQTREWIYVEDHCSAIDAVIKKGKAGKTYLVGSNQERHNIEVIKQILDLLSVDDALVEFVEDRKGHDTRYAIDSTSTQLELNWSPQHDFSQALKKTIQHYRENLSMYLDKVV